MGAIGDYIHYYKQNYNENQAAIIFAQKRKEIKERASNLQVFTLKEKEELENQLNNFYSGRQEDESSLIGKYQRQVEQWINEAAKDLYHANINWETGKVDISGLTGAALHKKVELINDIKRLDNTGYISKVALDNIILECQKMVKNPNEYFKRDEDAKFFKNKFKYIEDRLDILEENITSSGQSYSLKNIRGVKRGVGRRLITRIKELVLFIQAKDINNFLIGESFEYSASLIPIVSGQLAGQAANQYIKDITSHKIGGKVSQNTIDTELFSDNVDFKELGFEHKNKDETVYYSVGASQGKIDVRFDYNFRDSDKAKRLEMSLKNVNLKSGYDVHLVSKTNLIYYLQNENQNDFVNHYLNTITYNEDENKIGKNFMKAHYTVKLISIYKALTGDTLGKDKANLFVINDNSRKGGIKVLDMNEILKKVYSNADKFSIVNVDRKDLYNFKIKQNKEATVQLRITNILKNLHAAKLDVALKASLFQ